MNKKKCWIIQDGKRELPFYLDENLSATHMALKAKKFQTEKEALDAIYMYFGNIGYEAVQFNE